jgi:hypothetical protein
VFGLGLRLGSGSGFRVRDLTSVRFSHLSPHSIIILFETLRRPFKVIALRGKLAGLKANEVKDAKDTDEANNLQQQVVTTPPSHLPDETY